jgi:amphi-Trp domain-containing protein
MAKDRLEFLRISSPEEVADYLTSLAGALKRGEVTLESGTRTLRLTPSPDLRLELRVKEREDKGKVAIEIAWKQRSATRAADLRVESIPR